MKNSIITKLLIGYFIFGILGIIAISTISSQVTLLYLEDHYGRNLTLTAWIHPPTRH